VTKQAQQQQIRLPVVIPAAGIGSRMQAQKAKQYLEIHSKTILEHTISLMLSHPNISKVIVVLHPDDTIFNDLAIADNERVQTIIGGAERVDSVLAGLKYLASTTNDQQVLVHDAARPCLSHNDISKLIHACGTQNSGILAIPVADTIKQAEPSKPLIKQTIDRSVLWQAQTPQLSNLALLIDAIESALREGATITDEASALEYAGVKVMLVEGQASNLKITRPADLALAEYYLSKSN
jgi:2-C-methyl-D-erythritol 4-phosphate cytidylyltransferase